MTIFGLGASPDFLADLQLVGNSPVFRQTLATIKRLASFDAGVYISGETGTGKELAARSIHYLGNRCNYPFIPVNCGTFSNELLQSELFGHVEGAFTGARKNHMGLIEQADTGTLFLDEIDSLTHNAQLSLLRFLQDQQIRLVGGRSCKQIDVRVICASNIDLSSLVESKQFREDLYYRLDVLRVHMPPLRHRQEDITLLVRHFTNAFTTQYKLGERIIHPDTMKWMREYNWPGNVRELENYIRRLCIMSDDEILHDTSLFQSISQPGAPIEIETSSRYFADFKHEKQKVISGFEKNYLDFVMKQHKGNIAQAARHALKERKAFYRLLKKNNIERKDYI